jgi:hypothetical protein
MAYKASAAGPRRRQARLKYLTISYQSASSKEIIAVREIRTNMKFTLALLAFVASAIAAPIAAPEAVADAAPEAAPEAQGTYGSYG